MPLDKEYYHKNIFSITRGKLPKNRKHFRTVVYDNTLIEGSFGQIDPSPFEGKVIHMDDKVLITLSADKKVISVVDLELATHIPGMLPWHNQRRLLYDHEAERPFRFSYTR